MRNPAGLRKLVVAVVALAGFCGLAQAGTVHFDVVGDSATNNASTSFYGVQFTSGGLGDFIQSITYTLPTGVFDALSSVPADNIDGGSLNGVAKADISFSPVHGTGTNGPVLVVSFAAGTFGVGDSFRFGYDVDGLGAPDPVSGAHEFASKGVAVTVLFENGQSATGNFSLANYEASTLTGTLDVSTVPLPPAAWSGLALGVLVLLGARLRRRTQV